MICFSWQDWNRARANVSRRSEILTELSRSCDILLVSSVPIYGKDQKYSGAVAFVYDLTEIKRLEENARAAERLTELGTSRGRRSSRNTQSSQLHLHCHPTTPLGI